MDGNLVAAAPVAVFKKRGAKGKANIRKRPATPPPANSDSSDYDSSSEDETGQRIKRRKKNSGGPTVSSGTDSGQIDLSATVFKADRNIPITNSNDATKTSHWFDEDGKDASSMKNNRKTTKAGLLDGELRDGSYKGLANRPSFIQKNPDAPKKTVGPIKAPTNIRTVTVTDFAPDVCKDYRQTGFCGFGDNCKYLHIREDFKAGWQLDREWENVTQGKKNLGGTIVASADRRRAAAGVGEEGDDHEDETFLESIPFACIICKGPYKAPVATRCGHYFCEPCALQRYRRDPTCAACGSATNGIFNSAKRLQKLLERKRERAARRRQAAIEAGEEPSSDEEAEGEGGEGDEE